MSLLTVILCLFPFLIEQLLLEGHANDYQFLKQSNKKIEGVDDAKEFQSLTVIHASRFIFISIILKET